MLFSADAAPGLDGAASEEQVLSQDVTRESPTDSQVIAETVDQKTEATRSELVFVNDNVANYEKLIAGLQGGDADRVMEVVVLDSNRDGIEQISEVLANRSDLSAVHFITHGTEGQVKLGSDWLNGATLQQHEEMIAGWGKALSENGDILFYGCDVAADSQGQRLLSNIAGMTGADVAASDDITGNAQFGGDWVLEYGHGDIESNVAISSEAQANWDGVLTTFTVNTEADTADANPGDGVAQDASGNTSLRAAIMEANALGGSNEIILNPGIYRLTLGPAGDDAAANGDLDITSDITITGAGADVTIIDGNGLDRVFDVGWTGTLNMSNVTVQGGDATGSGGGIRVTGGGGGGRLNLTNVNVRNNTASSGGGGIHVDGVVTLTDVEISGNTTSGDGGGLSNYQQVTMDRVTISGNGAVDGAGIYNSNQGNLLDLTNVTISGNTATGNGGGIYTEELVNLTNVTLASNLSGGGIYVFGGQGEVQLKNSILANNTGGNSNALLTSQGYNIEDGLSAFTPIMGDQPNTDPLLGPLQHNGGFTPTHALLAGSPAIDAGDNSVGLAEDQRGYTRPVDGDGDATFTIDIGAFEYGGNTMVAVDEFLVNDGYETGFQETSGDLDHSQRAVAMADDGSYVVVWSSDGQDVSGWGVYAQRFDRYGAELTGEIRISEIDTGDEQWARVVSDGSGNFVVTWTSDHSGTADVYARRFDSSGAALGGEFRVNTTTLNTQKDSSIAMDAFGNFVVVWEGYGPVDSAGVFYRRFYANGSAMDATEVRANLTDIGTEQDASVAMNAAGDFVVVWEQGGYARFQMFASDGTPGAAGNVYSSNTGASNPDVAMDALGNFVVVYRWDGGAGFGVWAHKFNSSGVEQGYSRVGPGSFFENRDHDNPSITMDDLGNFIVTYESVTDGDPGDKTVFAERFQADITSLDRLQINQTTAGDQHMASVAMLDLDNFVVAFTGEDADQTGVFVRQYGNASTNTAPTATNLTSTSSYYEGEASVSISDIVVSDVDTGETITATLTLNDTSTGSLSANDGATYDGGTGIWTITDTVANVNIALANLEFNPNADNDVDTFINVVIDDGDEDGSGPLTGTITLDVTPVATADLYLTTEENVTSGGQDGLSTWNDEDLITIGDPNLSFGPGTTGTFAMGIDLTALTSGANVDAAHLVSRDLQIGTSNFQLRAGDLLLSDRGNSATYTSNTALPLQPGFSVDVSPEENDVVIFRPDTPGDYTRGQFGLLINNMVGVSYDLMGFTLIEQNITVGGYALKAGDFLYTNDYDFVQDNKIWLYQTGTVGSGSTPIDRLNFLDGDDAAVDIPREIQDLELLEQTTRIGDMVYAAGTILTHVDNPEQVGSNNLNVDKHDIIALDVTTSSLVGPGDASASLFFDGTSVNFGSTSEDLAAITLRMTSTLPNNAPTATNLTSTSSYTEGDPTVPITDIVVSDVDTGETITAILTLDDTATGSLSANDGATYDGGTGIWTITDTVANVNTALANLVFMPNADNDVDTFITTHIEDAAGTGPADGTITLDVTPANDPPTATNLTSTSSYTEGDATVPITDIVVSDVDAGEIITAILTLDDTATGSLSANDGATYDGGTGIWTITDTVANVNLALANLVFMPDTDNDVDTFITTHIEDAAGTGPADGTISLNVTPINDPPTATNLTSTSSYTEGDATVPITDIVVSDVDTAETITATLTLDDTATGSLSANDGATYDGGTGIWTITDTVANVNIALANLVFMPNTDNDVDTFITTHIEDAAGTGPVDGTITLDVTPVNDPPVLGNNHLIIIEGETVTLDTSMLSATDVDDPDPSLTFNVSAVTGGHFAFAIDTATAITSFDKDDITAGMVVFVHDGNEAAPSYSVSVTDGTNSTPPVPANITFFNQNDAPVLGNNSLTITEGATVTLDSSMLSATDVDNFDALLTFNVSGVTGGHFAFTTDTATAIISFDQIDITTGMVVFVHDGGQTAPSYSVSVTDGIAVVGPTPAVITFIPVNDPGTVLIDNMTPAQGDTLTANVSDPDGTSGPISYQWYHDGVIISGATGQTYTTTQADVGKVIRVTATYTDDGSTLESLTSADTAPVTNANDAPAAVDDNLNAVEDNSITFASAAALLANDADPDGDTLTLSGFAQPANGLLVDNGDGTLTYTPNSNFWGIDSFTYTVSDGNTGTADGTAYVLVAPVGDTPQVTNATTLPGVQTDPIHIYPHTQDGSEVTHFKISGITGGTLYHADGITQINNGDYITVAQGAAGLKFTPAGSSSVDGSFNVESSEDGVAVAAQSGMATSRITLATSTPPPDTPSPDPVPDTGEENPTPEDEVVEDPVTDSVDPPDVSGPDEAETPHSDGTPGGDAPALDADPAFANTADIDRGDQRQSATSKPIPAKAIKMLREAKTYEEVKTALEYIHIATLSPEGYALVRDSLDAIQEEVSQEIMLGKTVLGSAIATSVGLSAGYVIWLLKGGSLLASVLSSLPAWQLADPLTILAGKREKDDEDDDESLETIIEDVSDEDEPEEHHAAKMKHDRKTSAKR